MTSEVMDPGTRRPEAEDMTTATQTHTETRRDGITHRLARPLLLADAATTAGNGLAYLVLAPLLHDWLGTPAGVLRELGVFLLVVGAGVAVLATRRPVPRGAVRALAALNATWVVASVAYALLGDLTTIGRAWTVLQAGVVAAFAGAQLWLARRG